MGRFSSILAIWQFNVSERFELESLAEGKSGFWSNFFRILKEIKKNDERWEKRQKKKKKQVKRKSNEVEMKMYPKCIWI